MRKLKSIAAGIVAGVVTWFCIYILISLIAYRFGLRDSGQPGQPPQLPPIVQSPPPGTGVRVQRIEELPDLYLKSLARAAIIRFDKNDMSEGFKIVNMAIYDTDRDDILMAITNDLLLSLNYGGVQNLGGSLAAGRPPIARPPSNATPAQRLEYEKKAEESKKKEDERRRLLAEESRETRNQRIATIEAIAEKIGDPSKRAAALSQIAIHLVSPRMSLGMSLGPSEQKVAELEEREAAAAKDGSSAIEALKIEREKRIRKQRSIPDISHLWIGTILFAILGFIIVIFGNPVIEAFGKAIGEAMVKEFDSMRSYQQHKEAGRNA